MQSSARKLALEPRHILAAGLFLLPYMLLRPSSILFTLSDLFFVLGALTLIAGNGFALKPFGSLSALWFGSVGLMLTGLFASSITNGSADRWMSIFIQYSFSLLILPMILLVNDRSRWLFLVKSFVAGVVAMEAITFIILNYYGWNDARIPARFGPEFLTGMGRVSGFLGGANLHAAVLCMTLPFVYYLRASRAISRIYFAFAIGFIGAGIFYAASVTGLATAIIVTAAFLLLGRVRISPQFLAGMAVIVAVYLSLGSPAPKAFEKRIGGALESGNIEDAGTFTDRMELAREAWEMIDDTMFLGVGVDQFRLVSSHEQPVHVSHLLIWVEGGFPALLGWLGLISTLGLCGVMVLRTRPADAAVALSVLAAFLVFSTTAPHMYARVWIAPVILAMGQIFAVPHLSVSMAPRARER